MTRHLGLAQQLTSLAVIQSKSRVYRIGMMGLGVGALGEISATVAALVLDIIEYCPRNEDLFLPLVPSSASTVSVERGPP